MYRVTDDYCEEIGVYRSLKAARRAAEEFFCTSLIESQRETKDSLRVIGHARVTSVAFTECQCEIELAG